MERNILEDKVDRARYGYIVTRKEYYRELIKEMEELTFKLGTKIDSSNLLFNDLLKVDTNRSFLYEKLYDIIDTCVKVDNVTI